MKDSISIVLCSYNGKRFLQEQLDSILSQTCHQWQLMARDDLSSDGSEDVLRDFGTLGGSSDIVPNDKIRLGVKGNFSFMLEKALETSSRYIALSDQDDVWVTNKLSEQLELMKKLEQSFANSPLLIYSDLEVVDVTLSSIAPSMMRFNGFKHEAKNTLSVLLSQNFVTGCTVLINKPLLEIALPIPNEALMHDWWLALCAAVFGQIGFIDEPLVMYRQHDSNEVGAKNIRDFINPFSKSWLKRWLEGKDNLFQSMKQAEALAERIRERDPHNSNLALVEDYAELQGASGVQRIKRIKQLGIHAQSKTRHLLLLSRLLSSPSSNDG